MPRGFGAWGDMVLVLNDGARLEMRAVPRFREIEAYIESRRSSGGQRPGERPHQGFGQPEAASA